jgi:hypothetical protein
MSNKNPRLVSSATRINGQTPAMISATMNEEKLHGLLVAEKMKVTSLSYRIENELFIKLTQ